jgi:toxin secretion/phage lysis holin
MHDFYKIALSAVCGAVAAFFGQYGLFFILVAVAVVLDVLTGLVKAKATGEGLSSEKARRGFWRKIVLFIGLLFGIFLDWAAALVIAHTGISVGADMPFALIICAYIIINEAISIAENLYLTNPDSFPRWIAKRLKVAKKEIDRSQNEGEEPKE